MSYLLDTCVLSETRKGNRCNKNLRNWLIGADESLLWTSILVFGEIQKGIEQMRLVDKPKADDIEQWAIRFREKFQGRVLGIDTKVMEEWARLNAERKDLPVIDTLLAASANVHDFTLVTRNVRDFKGFSKKLLNPFNRPK